MVAFNEVEPYSNTWQYFFVCVEMFVVTCVQYIKYPTEEWEMNYREKRRKEMNILNIYKSNIFNAAVADTPIVGGVFKGLQGAFIGGSKKENFNK